ncbi:hypothetical protein MNBD_DELTA02-724 [hydrothermal vent metagenome]|uniref:Uncharacterized protein n=1 Tax=hydrothermal vent metagenome TaxID=652676 RepID=A0A3B0VZS5_9ZZZZ
MSIDKKSYMSVDEKNKRLGESVENVEKKVFNLGKSFDYLAERMPQVSAGFKAVGEFYKDAQKLDVSFSDTTDAFLGKMNKISGELDALKNGKGQNGGEGGKSSGKDASAIATALARLGVCACRAGAPGNPAAAGGVEMAAAAPVSGTAASLVDIAAQGGKEYATKIDEQIGSNGKREKKDKIQQIAAEEEMWAGRISAAGRGAGMISNIMQNLYQATGRKSKAMFTAMKAFAIAETVIQTYRAAQGAYAAMARIHPVLGVAAAAAAIAAGMARVKAIVATKPAGATGTVNAGGRANPSYRGGSFNAYPVPLRTEEAARQTQQITLNIYNPLSQQNWVELVEKNLLPALQDALERNAVVAVNTFSV